MTEIESEFSIRIKADKENYTLEIHDTGVGMTKADLINNLGVIARTGTTEFLDVIKEGGDLNLIG